MRESRADESGADCSLKPSAEQGLSNLSFNHRHSRPVKLWISTHVEVVCMGLGVNHPVT